MAEINIVELAQEILRAAGAIDSASILLSGTMGDKVPLFNYTANDMTDALLPENAVKQGPAKCIWVSDATDRNTYIYVILGPKDAGVKPVKMSLKENRILKISPAIAEFHIYWDAQSGKSLTIQFSSRVETTSKDLDNLSIISTGSSRELLTPVDIEADSGDPVLVLPDDADRIEAYLYFPIDVFLLASDADTPTEGLPIPAGIYHDTNKGALYAISQDGTTGTATGLIHK